MLNREFSKYVPNFFQQILTRRFYFYLYEQSRICPLKIDVSYELNSTISLLIN